MLKFVLAAMLAAVFPAAVLAQAQGQNPQPPAGLNEQDVQVLKEAVASLQQSFNPPASPSPGASPTATPAPAKSMADVADKVVDLGARAIAQAAGTIQKVAPEVWRIMIRQQYAKAAGLLTVPLGMFCIMLFAWFKTQKLRSCLADGKHSTSDEGWLAVGGWIGPILGMSIFGLWFLNRLADSIMYLFNPEYYAFRDLLMMLLSKGQGL